MVLSLVGCKKSVYAELAEAWTDFSQSLRAALRSARASRRADGRFFNNLLELTDSCGA